MITQARRQSIQRRLSRARTLVDQGRRVSVRRSSRPAAPGTEVVPSHRPVRGEFLGVVLFGYALPLVWGIGIVVDYLRHAR